MKKLENVVFTNLPEIELQTSLFEQGRPALQALVDLVNGWQIGQVQNIDELRPLVVNPQARENERLQLVEAWIDKKLSDQIADSDLPKFGFLRMSRKNFVRMVDRPDALTLVKLVAETFGAIIGAIELAKLEKSKVVLDKVKYDKLIQAYTLTAETPEEKQVLKLFSEITDRLQALCDMNAISNENELARLKQAGFLAQTTDLGISPVLFRNIKTRLSHE